MVGKSSKGWGVRALVASLALGFGLALLPGLALAQAGDKPLVFAAASLKNALDEVNAQWASESGKPAASVSYAASSALAKQIESGAPADLFVSADLEWMDYLAERKLVQPETRSNLLGNRLVLIAPKDSKVALRIAPGFDLAAALGGGRLAMADTASVPAGKYGKAALEYLKVWPSVQEQIAQSENVRAALALVARAEAPLGIVYQTDARAEPNVKVVDEFPSESHPPIVYPVARLKSSKQPDAAAFLEFLKSATAKELFEKQGFLVLQ